LPSANGNNALEKNVAIEEKFQERWYRINEAEQDARSRSSYYPRDFQEQPWTDADNADIVRSINALHTRIVRIEERQQVLYQITQETLKTVKAFEYMLYIVFAIYVLGRVWESIAK
jgi:hypothetical protein